MVHDKLRLAVGLGLAVAGGYVVGRWAQDVGAFMDLMHGIELRADWAVAARTAALTFVGSGATSAAVVEVIDHESRPFSLVLTAASVPFLAAGLSYTVHNTALIDSWQKGQNVVETVCDGQKSGAIMPLTTRDGRKLVVECP